MSSTYIKNRFGDYYLHEVNRGSFSQLGAYTTYQALYGAELFKSDHLYIIVGTDGGLLPAYIAQCGVPENSRYLFVELDHLWMSVAEHPQLSHKSFEHQIDIVSEKNWYSKVLALQAHVFLAREAMSCILSLSVQDPQDKQYMRLANHVFRPMETLQHDFLQKKMECQGLIYQLANIGDNQTPINLLQGQCMGWPAIYLGAEASLEVQLSRVKPYLSHCFIMADIKSLAYLLSEQVYPHMVVAIDHYDDEFSAVLFENNKPWPILLANSHAPSALVGNWLGPHVYLDERFPWQSSMNIPNISWEGESAAAVSLKVLLMLGCDRLFFLGVDLCYGDPFMSSALPVDNTMPYLHGESLGVTYHGEQRICDRHQLKTQKTMAHLAAEIETAVIYNLSKNAINVPGIEYADEKILETILNSEDVSISLYRLEKMIVKESSEDLTCCITTIKQSIERLAALEKITMDILEQAQLIYVSKKIEKEVTIERFRQILRKNYHEEAVLVNTLMYKELLAVEIESKEDKAYVAIIAEGIKQLKDLLHDAINRLKSRLEEQKPHPHWYRLTKQWKKDSQEGRAILWRNQHLQAYAQLKGHHIRKIQQLEINFLNKLKSKNQTTEKKFLPFTFYRLISLKRTFLQWAMNKNDSLLKQYVNYLQKVDDSDAQLLKVFCQGLMAELARDDDMAIEYYLKAAVGIFTEVALQQLTSLLIKRSDEASARRCLLCLGMLSPGYLPQYAYYCSLVGDFHEATSAYDDYLEEVPDDNQANDIRRAMLK
ncbi:MAG: 6-hydroxymethylpterin diphosphokinase MptE-like protein [Gammaproteobacteria bacterium]